MHAVREGTAVVIANGLKQGDTILDIIKGKQIGTLISRSGHTELAAPLADTMADEGGHLLPLWAVNMNTIFTLHIYTHTHIHHHTMAHTHTHTHTITHSQLVKEALLFKH